MNTSNSFYSTQFMEYSDCNADKSWKYQTETILLFIYIAWVKRRDNLSYKLYIYIWVTKWIYEGDECSCADHNIELMHNGEGKYVCDASKASWLA